jgi:hypothetical protein
MACFFCIKQRISNGKETWHKKTTELIGAKLKLRVQGRVFLGLFALHQAMLV